MVNYSATLDATFAALADPTRRAILERLAQREATVTELAAPFDVSLPAISRHVRVLEAAGLLMRERDGRLHRCRFGAEPLRAAGGWIARHREFWEGQLAALDRYLKDTTPREETAWQRRPPATKPRSASHGSSRPPGRGSSGHGRRPTH
jgi:DNA-binding transcriptional ArsR family regulator